jgi:hypothetical protein
VISAAHKAKDEEKCMQYLVKAIAKFPTTLDAVTFARATVLLASARQPVEACALIDEVYNRNVSIFDNISTTNTIQHHYVAIRLVTLIMNLVAQFNADYNVDILHIVCMFNTVLM